MNSIWRPPARFICLSQYTKLSTKIKYKIYFGEGQVQSIIEQVFQSNKSCGSFQINPKQYGGDYIYLAHLTRARRIEYLGSVW